MWGGKGVDSKREIREQRNGMGNEEKRCGISESVIVKTSLNIILTRRIDIFLIFFRSM